MPAYRNFYHNFPGAAQGNFGPFAYPGAHVPDVFESMASGMRDAFEGMNSGAGDNNASSTGQGNPIHHHGEHPNMPDPFADSGFPFTFPSSAADHGLPREGPPPAGFGDPRFGFGFGFGFDHHSGPFGDSGHHHHHHHHGFFGGRGGHGRFNPYTRGRGGPPPHFHHHHHPHGPHPHMHRGSFPFGFGFGFGARFPHPPPFFARPGTEGNEDFTKMYEEFAKMHEQMRAAAEEHHRAHFGDADWDARFAGRGFHSHRGRGGGRGGFHHAGRGRSAGPHSHRRGESCPRMSRQADLIKAWEGYTTQWLNILADDAPSTLKLADIPWPVVVDTTDMGKLSDLTAEITTTAVGDFILSPLHSIEVSAKKRIHQALKLYHPDRFERVVVAKVEEKHKKEVRELGEAVAKCLNTLLELENDN